MIRFFRLARSFSVNPQQMNIFDSIKGWWNPSGPMHILYQYNYHRVNFLLSNLQKLHGNPTLSTKPLQGFNILDAGCGAGILSQSLARLGGNVLAIDPNSTSINQARSHKQTSSNLQTLTYQQTTVEDILQQGAEGKYDIVTSMEVVEHVENPEKFVEDLTKLLKDKGVLMMSTIRRNWVSYITHILLAEYVTRIVPVGTHHHEKFLNPEEIEEMMRRGGCYLVSKKGLMLGIKGEFVECSKGDNYMIIAQKRVTNNDML